MRAWFRHTIFIILIFAATPLSKAHASPSGFFEACGMAFNYLAVRIFGRPPKMNTELVLPEGLPYARIYRIIDRRIVETANGDFIARTRISGLESEELIRRKLFQTLRRPAVDTDLMIFYRTLQEKLNDDVRASDAHLAEEVESRIFRVARRLAEKMLGREVEDDLYVDTLPFIGGLEFFASSPPILDRLKPKNAVGVAIAASARILLLDRDTMQSVTTIWIARQIIRDPNFGNLPYLISQLALLGRIPVQPSWREAMDIFEKEALAYESRPRAIVSIDDRRDRKKLKELAEGRANVRRPPSLQVFDTTTPVSSWMIAEENQLPGTDLDASPPAISFITSTQVFSRENVRNAAGEISLAILDSLTQASNLARRIDPLPVVAEILLSVRNQDELQPALTTLKLALDRHKRNPHAVENVRGIRVRVVLDPRGRIEIVPVAEAFSLPVVLEEGF
jgi:hypothetical protein